MLEASDWLDRSLREFYVFQGDAQEYSTNYFRPLVLIGFVAQMRLGGGDPSLMHGISLAIHVFNALLVAILTRALSDRATWRTITATTAGLAYVLHPALVESTAWISGQFDLLVTTFALLALVADRTTTNANIRAVLISLFFLLAALSKEAAVVLPLLLLITQWQWPGDHANALTERLRNLVISHWKTYVLMGFAGLIYLYVRWTSLGHLYQPAQSDVPLAARWHMFGYAYIEYWRLALAPFYDLSPLHEVQPKTYLSPSYSQWARTILSTSVLLSGFAMLVISRNRWAFAVCAFSVALLPVLHFLPMLIGLNLYAERFLTLPLAVLISGGAVAISSWGSYKKVRSMPRGILITILITAWLLAALVTTRSQVPLWSSNQTLWTWTYTKHPDSLFALNHLLAELVPRGDTERIDPHIKVLEEKGEVDVGLAITISSYYASKGEFNKAMNLINGVYRASAEGTRMHTYALINYSIILVKMEDYRTAERVIRDAVKKSPENGDAHLYLVRILSISGKREQAEKELPIALKKVSPIRRAQVQNELLALIRDASDEAKARHGGY